jgi:hypothetical protein
MNLQPIKESKHEELTALVNPLIEFMVANGYTYFLVAGKDGTCTRHMRGDYFDLHGMLKGMIEKQPQVGVILREIVEEHKKSLE